MGVGGEEHARWYSHGRGILAGGIFKQRYQGTEPVHAVVSGFYSQEMSRDLQGIETCAFCLHARRLQKSVFFLLIYMVGLPFSESDKPGLRIVQIEMICEQKQQPLQQHQPAAGR